MPYAPWISPKSSNYLHSREVRKRQGEAEGRNYSRSSKLLPMDQPRYEFHWTSNFLSLFNSDPNYTHYLYFCVTPLFFFFFYSLPRRYPFNDHRYFLLFVRFCDHAIPDARLHCSVYRFSDLSEVTFYVFFLFFIWFFFASWALGTIFIKRIVLVFAVTGAHCTFNFSLF